MLHHTHPNPLAIWLCFPQEVLDQLFRQACRKLVSEIWNLAVNLIDTSDLEHGYAADLWVDEVNQKKGDASTRALYR